MSIPGQGRKWVYNTPKMNPVNKWVSWEAILQRKFWSWHSPNFHHWKTCKNLVLWLSLIGGCFSGDHLFVLSPTAFLEEPGEGGQGDETSGAGRCLRQFLTVPLTFPLKEKGTVLLTKVVHSVEDDGEGGWWENTDRQSELNNQANHY